MVWIYYFLLLIGMCASLFLVLIGLPGIWMLGGCALIYAWITHFQFLGRDTLIALLLLAILSEIVELGAAGIAAKSAGGSSRASLGAIVGAFIGGLVATFLIPIAIIGTLIGVVVGAFLGSLLLEQTKNSDANHLLRVGFAAAKGRLLGTILKLIFAAIMFILAMILAFPF